MTASSTVPVVEDSSSSHKTVKQHTDDLITTPLLQHRLAVGIGLSGGARGSLHRCAVQLAATGNNTTGSSSNSNNSLLLTDLSIQQLEMTKLILQVQRNEQELQRLERLEKAELATSTDAFHNHELHQQLLVQRQLQGCYQEYEALAALTLSQHSVSESVLQQELKDIEQQHNQAFADLERATDACQIRISQIHLFQQCLQDLRLSLEEDESTTTPLPQQGSAALWRPSGETDVAKAGASDARVNEIATSMDIDEDANEEGELYSDL